MGRTGIVVLLLFALAGCASHHAQQPGGQPAPHTVVKTFHAYDANGDLAVHVADVATGQCWTTSIAAPAPGAYRCISGNAILDPCFAPAHPTSPVEVACLADPWSNAEVLRVTGALPTTPPLVPDGRARPWAFQLAIGARCVAATGTVPAVDGVNLGYHCRAGGDAAVRNASAALMTADFSDARHQRLQAVTITTIWEV